MLSEKVQNGSVGELRGLVLKKVRNQGLGNL